MRFPRHRRPFAYLTLNTRRRRRAAVAALWSAFGAHVAVSALGGDGELAGFGGFVTLLAGLVCMFSLAEASGLRGGSAPLDARRLAARDRAYSAAFHATGWLMLALVVYAELALRIDALWLPSDPRGAVGAFAAVGVAIGLLPVSLIGWAEPDEAPATPPLAPTPPRKPHRYVGTLDDREIQRWLH
ncbi:hypothetical protein [Longimicrobium sp.]|uniref:hypothetical protein n=1 Tax=Longimicrobium sp. TaxID=2029185 RepID=UPI002E33EE36|nr:hypothetical protein [Longimicrobium sp.]HEX6041192.1 hypothetical protein [Longimicrobium sp.]